MSFFDRVAGVFASQDEPTRTRKLDEWLEETLKREFKVDSIERDADGDIPVPCGSAVAFIRAFDEEPSRIHIFAPLLGNFMMRPEVYEAVNSINLQVPLAKAVVETDSNQIILAVDLIIFDELSSDQLMAAIELIADRADYYDSRLQKRFGGTTMLDDTDEDELDV